MPSATQAHESRPEFELFSKLDFVYESLVPADLIQICPRIRSYLLQHRDILIRHISLESNHFGYGCCEVPVAVVAPVLAHTGEESADKDSRGDDDVQQRCPPSWQYRVVHVSSYGSIDIQCDGCKARGATIGDIRICSSETVGVVNDNRPR